MCMCEWYLVTLGFDSVWGHHIIYMYKSINDMSGVVEGGGMHTLYLKLILSHKRGQNTCMSESGTLREY